MLTSVAYRGIQYLTKQSRTDSKTPSSLYEEEETESSLDMQAGAICERLQICALVHKHVILLIIQKKI